MADTPNLALPYLDPAQAQKHVTHNAALAGLDTLVQLSVKQRDLSAPPSSPADGDRYLVPAGASGAFAGHDGAVAAFLDGAWIFSSPRAGWRCFVVAEGALLIYTGGAWADVGAAIHALQNLSQLGVGAAASPANPLTAKLNSALFTARTLAEGGVGDLRLTLNKSAAANTVSQIYQDNYSGRAETGLCGDDHFHIKVSADGATWREALNIDPATGVVSFPSGALTGAASAYTSADAINAAPAEADYVPSMTSGGAFKRLLLSTVRALVAPFTTATFPEGAEVGVINPGYPVGDVRRYGVFPDGRDLTGLTFNGSTTVSGSAGTFTSAMIGMSICSPNVPFWTKITAVAGDGSSATLSFANGAWAASTAYQVGAVVGYSGAAYTCSTAHTSTGSFDGSKWTVKTTLSAQGARVGTCWEGDYPSRTLAIYQNAVIPGIEIVWPRGKYVTSLNFSGSASSNTKMRFDGCEFSGVFHLLADAGFPSTGSPLANLALSGSVTLYDRFGSAGLQNSDLSRLNVRCKSDAAKNLSGLPGRGVHIYTQIVGNLFGKFIVDDSCVGTLYNADGGFVMDSSDCHDNHFDQVWVKDAAGHGVFMLGANNTIRDLRVDAWGYGTQDRQMGETATLAQSQELCAVWFRRCPGLKVGTLRINQTGTSRANALYGLRVDDTQNGTYAPPSYAIPRIDNLIAANIQHRGLSIGDRNNAATYCELSIGQADLHIAAGVALDSGYSAIHVNGNSSPSNYGRNKLVGVTALTGRSYSTTSNDLLSVAASCDFACDRIEAGGANAAGWCGGAVRMLGAGRVGRIYQMTGGDLPNTSVVWTPDQVSSCGPVNIDGTYSHPHFSTGVMVDMTNAANFGEIGPVSCVNVRPSTAALQLSGASNGVVRLGNFAGYATQGFGVNLVNATNVRFEGGFITAFYRGTQGGGNTRCSAVNAQNTGNTVNSNLASGQVLVDASCLTFTL